MTELERVPKITPVRKWERPQKVADTERGLLIRAEIELLEKLVEAYQLNALREIR